MAGNRKWLEYLVVIVVSVVLDQFASQRVLVVGEVQRAASYPLTGRTTVLEMLLQAGAPTQNAAAEASLAIGSPVKGTGGADIGTIESIDTEFVTLKLTSGKSVRIPRSGIAGSAQGAVVGLTVADLETQTSGDSASN